MKLTGKCKEDFEKWFWTSVPRVDINIFYNAPFSMQYGVLVDFFDSVGINIEMFIEYFGLGNINGYYSSINESNNDAELSRHEARAKAIEKANEIYNNK